MSNLGFLLFIAETSTILCEKKDLSDGKAQSARETMCSTTEVGTKDKNIFAMRKRKIGKTVIIISITVGDDVKDDWYRLRTGHRLVLRIYIHGYTMMIQLFIVPIFDYYNIINIILYINFHSPKYDVLSSFTLFGLY